MTTARRQRSVRLTGLCLVLEVFFAALRSEAGDVALGHQQPPRTIDERSRRSVPPMFGGIQVNEPDHDRWAAALRDDGLDAVQVTLYARQQEWDTGELHWDRDAPWVVSEIRAARRAGLRTMLVMRVALEHGRAENRHLWHGMIWPRAEELAGWFANYREFVLWGAAIAAAEGVDLFVLGNELSSMTSTTRLLELPELYAYYLDPERTGRVRSELVQCADRVLADGAGVDLLQLDGGRYADLDEMLLAEETRHREWTSTVVNGGDGQVDLRALNARRAEYQRFWVDLAAEVGAHFPGPISYGANFDQFEEVGFWDVLDAVALNAYFPLGLLNLENKTRSQVLDRALERSWLDVVARVRGVAGADPLPVLFVELGWTRKLGATVRPYAYSRVEVLETYSEVGMPGESDLEGDGTGARLPYPLTCVHLGDPAREPNGACRGDAGSRARCARRGVQRVARVLIVETDDPAATP